MFAFALASAVCIFIAYVCWKHKKLANSLPPGPPPLPLVGNLLQIDIKDPRKTFVEWHKKYGQIYTVWLGHVPNIFVTGHELMQELFVKRGDEFTDRPFSFIFFDSTKGPYGVVNISGDSWKEQRRFSLQVMRNFGFGRKLMEEKISSEIAKMLKDLETSLDSPNRKNLDFKPIKDICVVNIISSLLLGRIFTSDDPDYITIKFGLDRIMALAMNVSINILDSFPWLRFVPFYGRLGYDEFFALNEQIFEVFISEIDRHKKEINQNFEPNDFIDAYLIELKRRRESGMDIGSFSEWQLTCILNDLLTAGMETTITTLDWAILLMMHYPDIQQKVQKEIDYVVGSERLPTMNDRLQMPYTCATIQELQRYANILVSNLPHAANKDLDIVGYKILKGTTVIPQITVVHWDDDIFNDPLVFNPERFLGEDKKTLKKCETTLMPFSLGKRICLGEGLARMELFLIFTSLLQKFSWTFVENELVPDLTPVASGVTSHTKPYNVCISFRN